MSNFDEKVLELYEKLNITEDTYAPYPQMYDITTPYEKCSATVNVPVIIGNSTSST